VHHPRCSSRSGHLDARAPLVPSPEGYVGRRRRGADGIGAVRGGMRRGPRAGPHHIFYFVERWSRINFFRVDANRINYCGGRTAFGRIILANALKNALRKGRPFSKFTHRHFSKLRKGADQFRDLIRFSFRFAAHRLPAA
jgi:hypothetical protein